MWTKVHADVEQQCQHFQMQEVQRGGTTKNFVGCPVLTELQEGWDCGVCILFMGQKT